MMKATVLNITIPKHSSLKNFYEATRNFQCDVLPFIGSYACFEWKVSEEGIDYGTTTLGLDKYNQDFDFNQSIWFSEEIDGNFQHEASIEACEKRNGIKLNHQQRYAIDSFYSVVPEIREISELDSYIQQNGSKILIEKKRILFFDSFNVVEIEQ
jgi:hypothetical protein